MHALQMGLERTVNHVRHALAKWRPMATAAVLLLPRAHNIRNFFFCRKCVRIWNFMNENNSLEMWWMDSCTSIKFGVKPPNRFWEHAVYTRTDEGPRRHDSSSVETLAELKFVGDSLAFGLGLRVWDIVFNRRAMNVFMTKKKSISTYNAHSL